jgi:hypothetical protein
MAAEVLVLRLIHVLGAIAWVGFASYNSFFLIPSFADAGPAAAPVMAGLQKRKLFTILPVIAILTILSGLRLLMIASTGFSAEYFATRSGLAYAAGGAAGVLGFAIGMTLTRPSLEKAGALLARRASTAAAELPALDAEVGRLRRLGYVSGWWSTAFLLVAAGAMAIARYL